MLNIKINKPSPRPEFVPKPNNNVGGICPRCGKVHAPHIDHCNFCFAYHTPGNINPYPYNPYPYVTC